MADAGRLNYMEIVLLRARGRSLQLGQRGSGHVQRWLLVLVAVQLVHHLAAADRSREDNGILSCTAALPKITRSATYVQPLSFLHAATVRGPWASRRP